MIRPFASAALLLALLPLAAAAQDGPRPEGRAVGRGSLRAYANPSAVIAAELALSRDAAARGQWTALAAAAAPQAVVAAPRLGWAHGWLKGRANPPVAQGWRPFAVWSSCDGSLVASRGRWSGPDGKGGWYLRLWERQGDGAYKWLVGEQGLAARDEAEPDMLSAEVAECPARRPTSGDERGRKAEPKPSKPKNLPPPDPLHRAGAAGDGTLRWDEQIAPDGTRRLVVRWRKNGSEQTVLDETVPAG